MERHFTSEVAANDIALHRLNWKIRKAKIRLSCRCSAELPAGRIQDCAFAQKIGVHSRNRLCSNPIAKHERSQIFNGAYLGNMVCCFAAKVRQNT